MTHASLREGGRPTALSDCRNYQMTLKSQRDYTLSLARARVDISPIFRYNFKYNWIGPMCRSTNRQHYPEKTQDPNEPHQNTRSILFHPFNSDRAAILPSNGARKRDETKTRERPSGRDESARIATDRSRGGEVKWRQGGGRETRPA
jgi:hypothetical protein